MTERMTIEEWRAKGLKLFGADELAWRFICPSCGHVAPVSAWRDAGAPENTVAFSCVGRWMTAPAGTRCCKRDRDADGNCDKHSSVFAANAFRGKGGPCDYAGGGLFAINPITVVMPDGKERGVFAFADVARRVEQQP